MRMPTWAHASLCLQAKRYLQELERERAIRQDATNAVMKLQEVIMGVRDEMVFAAQAANIARVELDEEQSARQQAEDTVIEMREQLLQMQDMAQLKAAEAQKIMSGFRSEMDNMKSRNERALKSIEEKRMDVKQARACVLIAI